ncbi:MAG: ComEC/Rec2 family competence protein [Desulfovibrio sp.]|nr:ComEC/Rec2 family competence protein [Desulfovibrio sp.]
MRHPPLQAPLLWQIYFLFWIAGILSAVWPLPALACALLLLFLDRRLHTLPRVSLATILTLSSLVLTHLQLTPPQAPAWLDSTQGLRLCGTVDDVQGLPDQRLRLLLADVRPQDQPDARPLSGLLAWTWEEPQGSTRPLAGQAVCLSRTPRPMHGFANTGLAPWDVYWAARGVYWRIWSRASTGQPTFSGPGSLSARWREELRQRFTAALGLPALTTPMRGTASDALSAPQGLAILPALLFGDRYYLQQDTVDNFAAATLAHSLALSGQHLVIAGLAGLLCILGAARLWPWLYLHRPRSTLAVLAACPPALVYLWLGNAPASLVRAVCMLLVLAFWLSWQKVRTTLDILWAALACICLAAPLSILDTGLQLSALCVTVIGISLPWLRRILPEPPHAQDTLSRRISRRTVRAALSILLMSLFIQTALLPLNLLLFGNAGFWFPLNILWLPLVDTFVLPAAALGLLLSGAGLDHAAGWLLHMAALPCCWLTDGLAWLRHADLLHNPAIVRPHWTALPAFALLCCALALAGSRPPTDRPPRRLLVTALALLCLGPLLRLAERSSSDLTLDMLDVGQGQALSLYGPEGVSLVIDGGGSFSPRFDPGAALVAPSLSYNRAPHLSAVCNSHPHQDHLGGLFHLLQFFTVAALYDNGHDAQGQQAETWRTLRQEKGARALAQGDSLILGQTMHGIKLEVLHPPRETSHSRKWRDNDASLVLRLTRHGKGLALFTGDAERPALLRLLASGQDLRAQILIAPHHGASGSFLPAFYKAVQPDLVLVSCGFQNRYNYPAKRLRQWLEKEGIPLLHTGQHGQIRITWPAEGPFRLNIARGKDSSQ